MMMYSKVSQIQKKQKIYASLPQFFSLTLSLIQRVLFFDTNAIARKKYQNEFALHVKTTFKQKFSLIIMLRLKNQFSQEDHMGLKLADGVRMNCEMVQLSIR
ncbi:hypothetical protein OUZ56_018668 [Daphnia magna]|uniref:Uncharacterized protein n=1 Tax=Daphnia magna TaxID=35525 RepID=A0ABQ9ZA21_9CRUS|nr:hypothetical protein OUZ56_018668 [Daphnia magna]